MSRRKQVAIVLAIFVLVVIADQVTKAIIMAKISEHSLYYNPYEPPKFFQFTHQRNPGVVGGIFRTNRLMAYAAPIMASFVLVYLFWFLDRRSKIQTLAFGLIAGGAVGNLIDRLRLGSVTDFLEFNFYFVPFDFPWKHFPSFNVADSCICTGVFVLVVAWFLTGQRNVPHPA
jgi:signal peptidase II